MRSSASFGSSSPAGVRSFSPETLCMASELPASPANPGATKARELWPTGHEEVEHRAACCTQRISNSSSKSPVLVSIHTESLSEEDSDLWSASPHTHLVAKHSTAAPIGAQRLWHRGHQDPLGLHGIAIFLSNSTKSLLKPSFKHNRKSAILNLAFNFARASDVML